MPRARRNTRCSRCCSRARPTRRCSIGCALLRATRPRSGWRMPASREAASRTNAERVEREYFNLFIGLGRGELLPYGSYYLTGFLHERPLARLRETLARSASSAPTGRPSPRITPRSCARSWPALPAGASRRRGRRPRAVRAASCALDRALLRRSGAGRGGRLLPRASARSAGCSSRSRQRPSRCRREPARGDNRKRRVTQ